MVSFADDLVVVVISKYPDSLQLYGIETINVIKSWLPVVKLDLADEKAGRILIFNPRKSKTVKIRVSNHVHDHDRFKIEH